jgi:hypothetical protein
MNETADRADEKLTKLTGNVIAAVSAQVRHLVDAGLVEPDKLRLTIGARREKAKNSLTPAYRSGRWRRRLGFRSAQ